MVHDVRVHEGFFLAELTFFANDLKLFMNTIPSNTEADPGFVVGRRRPRRGAADSQGVYVSKILYVETNLDPLGRGGVRRARPLDPPMKYDTTSLENLLPVFNVEVYFEKRSYLFVWKHLAQNHESFSVSVVPISCTNF